MAEGTIKIKEMEELTELTDNDYFVVDNLQSGVPTKKYKATRVIQMIENVADEIEEKITPSIDTALAVGSVSGDIASFSDGSTLPMPKLQVGIEPVQDLHGYDHPWVGGAGRNLFNMGSKINGNFANMTVVSDDNYITFNGTKYGQNVGVFSALTFSLGAGTYYAKAFAISGTAEVLPTISVYKAGGSYATDNILNAEKSFALDAETTLNIAFTFSIDNKVYSNYKLGVVISKTSSIDKFYPYSNICPISGWDECNVSDVSANVWDEETKSGYYVVTTGSYISNANQLCSKDYISVRPNMTLYGYKGSYTRYGELLFYDSNHDYIGYLHATQWINKEFTIPSNCYYITFNLGSAYGTTYNNDISINYPATDTSYHAYADNTYEIQLGDTRYGGTLDVTTGELVVNRAMVDMGAITWSYTNNRFYYNPTNAKVYTQIEVANLLCSQYPNSQYNSQADNSISSYAGYIYVRADSYSGNTTAFKTAMNGVQLVYELATPITYQLTPTQVKSLLGSNNVWADTGEIIDCEYKRDATAIINSLIARIEALENQ